MLAIVLLMRGKLHFERAWEQSSDVIIPCLLSAVAGNKERCAMTWLNFQREGILQASSV